VKSSFCRPSAHSSRLKRPSPLGSKVAKAACMVPQVRLRNRFVDLAASTAAGAGRFGSSPSERGRV